MATTLDGLPVVLIACPGQPQLTNPSALADHRYRVSQAHTGQQAIDLAREQAPDTIILDADLPDMSGIDACRLLRGDLHVAPGVPILIVCADEPSAEQRVTALRAGAWGFVPTPRDAAALALPVAVELELAEMTPEEAAELAEELGLGEVRGAPALVAAGYRLLDLLTFFTGSGPPEARAWPVPRGTTADRAAGRLPAEEGPAGGPGITGLAQRIFTRFSGRDRSAPPPSSTVPTESVETAPALDSGQVAR